MGAGSGSNNHFSIDTSGNAIHTGSLLELDTGTSSSPAHLQIMNNGSTGYTGADIRLRASNHTYRGAGIYFHNEQATDLWYAGLGYANSAQWSLYFQGTGFAVDVNESDHKVLYVEQDGDVYTTTGTDIQQISDRRIKKNIKDYSGGLDIIKQLKPRTFEYKKDKARGRDGVQYGFIAQEIEEIDGLETNMHLYKKSKLSEVDVDADVIDDLEIYGTQLSSKEAILISAIQELTTRLEALENA